MNTTDPPPLGHAKYSFFNKIFQFESCSALDDDMCEGRYGGWFAGVYPDRETSFPEITSAVTALFIVWCGFHILTFFRSDSHILHLVGASFFVNGIASCIAHIDTSARLGAIIDRWTMVLMAWLTCGYMIDEFVDSLRRFASYRDRHRDQLTVRQLEREANFTRQWRRAVGWVTCLSFAWLFLAEDALCHHQTIVMLAIITPLLFALALGGGVMVMNRCHREAESRESEVDDETKREREEMWGHFRWARKRMCIGLTAAVFGIACQLFTEGACDSSRFAQLFPGHALWHMCFAWGVLNMLIFAALLRLDNHNSGLLVYPQADVMCGNTSAFTTWYFYLFPGFEFVHKDCLDEVRAHLHQVDQEASGRRIGDSSDQAIKRAKSSPALGSFKSLGMYRSRTSQKIVPEPVRTEEQGDS